MTASPNSLPSLLAACEHIDKLPSPISQQEAVAFTAAHPLDAVFQLLSTHEADQKQLELICIALDKVLASQHGTDLLLGAQQYAEAALASPQHRLRLLGVQQLGRLLLLRADQQQEAMQLETSLIKALQDDTGIAGAAEKALLAYLHTQPPAALADLLCGSSTAATQLAELSGSRSATQRMRAFALLVQAAAGSRSHAEQLKQAGVVHQLLEQLNPRDPLACLVALQLLQELVPHTGGAAAGLMQDLLLPALLPLLEDPSTAAGTFPIAAQLVAAAAAAAGGGVSSAMEVDGAAAAAAGAGGGGSGGAIANSNGNGVCGHSSAADVLLSKMSEVLDDRGSAGVDEELVVLDAAHHLAQPSPASATLLTAHAAGTALPSICAKALGRTSSPDVRLAALHVLASVAGLERAGESRDRSAALMEAAAEDALRRAVFGAVSGSAGGAGGARTPAEAMWQLLQQPFDETRTGVYRCCAALALRPWFAADVCSNSSLLGRLCSTDSESGQQACEWRHSTVMALWATVQYVLALPDDAAEGQYKQRLPAAVQQQLAVAVRGGPYGAGGVGRSTQQSQFVATVP